MANKTIANARQAAATCELFKAVPNFKKISAVRIDDQLQRGFLFVDGNTYAPVAVDISLYNIAEELYGISPEQMNATFYSGFDETIGRTRFQLFVDQVMHYMGTYGREAVGLKPITILPVQEMHLPEIDVSKLKITVIRVLSDGQLVNLINDAFLTIKAPSRRMIANLSVLVPLLDVDPADIRSFELAILVYDTLGITPTSSKMFLRYLVFKMTGDTMVINNQRTVRAIKNALSAFGAKREIAIECFRHANLVSLASIFLRYKNLFLAFKCVPEIAPIINKLRRMANTYHQPLSDKTIQNYLQHVLKGNLVTVADLREKMDTRDMVKVCNAIGLRLDCVDGDPMVYNVRNGRSFCVESVSWKMSDDQYNALFREYNTLYELLCKKLSKSLMGKTFYIPGYIDYAAPQSEKQFVGNLPWGTAIHTGIKNCTVGVSWFNVDDSYGGRVDIDLHAFDAERHYGWNANYYDYDATVVYSGDMTSAPLPNGAAEAFQLADVKNPIIFTLSKYSGPMEIPYKLYFTADPVEPAYGKQYTMDPNKLLMSPIPMKFRPGENALTLGFFDDGEFVLYSGNLSNSAVPNGNYAKYLEAIITQQESRINLRSILRDSGALVVSDEGARDKLLADLHPVIDLSPEALDATTLMNLIDGKA